MFGEEIATIYLDNTKIIELKKIFGPLEEDKWHSDRIQITELKFEFFRVINLHKLIQRLKKI